MLNRFPARLTRQALSRNARPRGPNIANVQTWLSSSSEASNILDEDEADDDIVEVAHNENLNPAHVMSPQGRLSRPSRGGMNDGFNDASPAEPDVHPPGDGKPTRTSIMDKIRQRLLQPSPSLADGLDECDDLQNIEECPICMEVFDETEHARAQPSECKHSFCITCLLKWSAKTNTCPLCKRKYSAIKKFEETGSEPLIVPVSVLEESEQENSDDEMSDSGESSILISSRDDNVCVVCEEEDADMRCPTCVVGHNVHSQCYRGLTSCPGCLVSWRAPAFMTLGETLASLVVSNIRRRQRRSRRET
eukprot:Gregarina_sp_Pseudo_9__2715@NODE_295_length_3258_cov_23_063063_g276_i0_p3_GENE_NODE_295_length_3258_cov_23_063063_g276_i0NODE_295_length_3258_cov_23_063063_g276_i0_p3_ORF_typecomplete_len306_score60_77zfRING_2/PF13639_6/3_2e11zfRING_2/PF13639_6/63zfC3HC4_3/PF13920_6/3_5e08zfC3HC4_3/PF13920_6/0_15zfC3HC4_2/PF13923_6/1_1e09zfC3HC4_2/PF13923_6/2_7e03zfC3HC4/PF00097_25/4_1e09zfC3HC4/PF00097_25/19ProkRING_4/PF14447_6/24ProkRING_4/PF14447_6/6_4e06ProkRING_4/PF14447_6/1_3zfRING_5/PF14634_6/2_3e07zfRING